MSFEAYDDRGVVDAPSRRVPNRAMAQGAEADVRGTPARDASSFERWETEKANERARSPSNSDRRRVERGAAVEAGKDQRSGNAVAPFARRAVIGATETALLPYRGARALSGGRLPELSAEEAYAQAESLARDEPVAATRERQSVQDRAHPDARNIGDAAGQVADPFLAAEAMKGGLRLRALGGVRGTPADGPDVGRLYYRVQPRGMGTLHRSETSAGRKSKGLHVFSNPSEAERLSEGIGYGDEAVVLSSRGHRPNHDVEGVEIDGSKARVVARIPHSEFKARDWESLTQDQERALERRASYEPYGIRTRPSLLSDDRGFAEWRPNKAESEAEKVLGTPRPDARRLVGSPRFASGGELRVGRGESGVEARAIADEGEAVSTFRRDVQGRLVVEDNYLEVPEFARQEGQGREIMANKLREYDRLGADRVQFEADFDGRYVWPHLGYQVDKPTLKALEKRFNEHLESVGEEPIRARRIQDISEHPEGKDFLLDGYTEPFQMHLDLGSREADALRKRLGVPSNRRSF